jgi:predicted nucleic acid-binding protein
VLIDSGPLYAAFDTEDAHHSKAYEFFRTCRGSYASTWPVVTEVAYLLRKQPLVRVRFLEWIRQGAMLMVELTPEDIARVIEVMQKYADLPADFADATLVAIADRIGATEVVSFDSDFDVYRRADGAPFIRLPA